VIFFPQGFGHPAAAGAGGVCEAGPGPAAHPGRGRDPQVGAARRGRPNVDLLRPHQRLATFDCFEGGLNCHCDKHNRSHVPCFFLLRPFGTCILTPHKPCRTFFTFRSMPPSRRRSPTNPHAGSLDPSRVRAILCGMPAPGSAAHPRPPHLRIGIGGGGGDVKKAQYPSL